MGFIASLVDDLFLLESHLDARVGKLLCNVEQPGCHRRERGPYINDSGNLSTDERRQTSRLKDEKE